MIRIVKVTPIRGAYPTIRWEVTLIPDWWGDSHVLFDWTGDVVFTRQAVAAKTWPSYEDAPMRLPARWVNRERSIKIRGRRETALVFETILSSEALVRVDRFRGGNSVFARLEGEFVTVVADAPDIGDDLGERRAFLAEQILESNKLITAHIGTESYELSRDFWSKTILGELRPPGHVVVELALPTAGGRENSLPKSCLAELKAAQAALDDYRLDDVAERVYEAIVTLSKFDDRLGAHYDAETAKCLIKQRENLVILAQRGDDGAPGAGESSQSPMTRSLAHCLFLSAWALCGAYFPS